MKLSKLAQTGLFVSISCFGSVLTSTHALASDNQLNKVVKVGEKINESASQSQQRINQYSQKIQTKLQQYKAIMKETDGLKIYNKQMQAQLDSQLVEMSELFESINQVSVIERQISPLMARMISSLDTFVSLDVPFLQEERAKRIEGLKNMMARADVSVSEKFRRVLEAYQVEVDYGRTIEAYSGLQTIDGKPQDVDYLRIGRISLVYQTRDGSQLARWDNTSKQWQKLPDSYRMNINKGLRIARKQLAPDLLMVPVVNTGTTRNSQAD